MSHLPPEVRLDIVAGESHIEEVIITQPVLVAGAFVETPVNLDGWLLKAVMRKTGDPAPAAVKSTVNGGIEILDQAVEATRGHARIHFLPLDTATATRAYGWQLRGWDPSGAVKALQRGTVRIGANIA